MATSEFIDYKGREILFLDVSNCTSAEIVAELEIAAKKIASKPEKSVLVLTDSTNGDYSSETSNAMTEFSKKNTPYVKGSAVIGADPMRKILVSVVRMATKRDIKTFDSKTAALDWLVSL